MKLAETPDVGTSTSTQSIVLEAVYGIFSADDPWKGANEYTAATGGYPHHTIRKGKVVLKKLYGCDSSKRSPGALGGSRILKVSGEIAFY